MEYHGVTRHCRRFLFGRRKWQNAVISLWAQEFCVTATQGPSALTGEPAISLGYYSCLQRQNFVFVFPVIRTRRFEWIRGSVIWRIHQQQRCKLLATFMLNLLSLFRCYGLRRVATQRKFRWRRTWMRFFWHHPLVNKPLPSVSVEHSWFR